MMLGLRRLLICEAGRMELWKCMLFLGSRRHRRHHMCSKYLEFDVEKLVIKAFSIYQIEVEARKALLGKP